MAGQKLFRRDHLIGGRAALGLPRGEKNICERDEEDMVMYGGALSRDRALEEGG
jgi:hypothetical protein